MHCIRNIEASKYMAACEKVMGNYYTTLYKVSVGTLGPRTCTIRDVCGHLLALLSDHVNQLQMGGGALHSRFMQFKISSHNYTCVEHVTSFTCDSGWQVKQLLSHDSDEPLLKMGRTDGGSPLFSYAKNNPVTQKTYYQYQATKYSANLISLRE